MVSKKSRKSAREAVRQQSKAAYQELILEAAHRVFVERGFAGTRMADVAAEAGVSTGTLYNYFAGKDEVLRSLVEMRTQGFLEGLDEVFASTPEPRQRLAALIGFVFEYLETNRATIVFLMETDGMAQPDLYQVDENNGDCHAELVSLFTRAIDALLSQGQHGEHDVADLASFLTGAMHGMARAWLVEPEPGQLAARAPFVTEMFLRAIGAGGDR